MAILIFKNEKLRSILKITEQATEFKATFEEAVKAYESKTGKKYKPGISLSPYYSHNSPTLWLVKDTGIYLMTPAKFEKFIGEGRHLCFAEGFAPNESDLFEKAQAAVGGDDFIESFEFTDAMKRAIRLGADIQINLTEENYTVELIMPEK